MAKKKPKGGGGGGNKLVRAALDFIKKAENPRDKSLPGEPSRMDGWGVRHVLHGHEKRGDRFPSGYHARPGGQDMPGRRIKPGTRKEIKNGVYEAEIEFYDSSRKPPWKEKRGGASTFFPDDWSPQKVDRAIDKAFQNSTPHPNDPNKWVGRADGIVIEGFVDASKPGGYSHGWPSKNQ